jgi:hypothetical protein
MANATNSHPTRALVLLFSTALGIMAGCAPSLIMRDAKVRIVTPRIAIMGADVEIRERDVNGEYTLKDDWTAAAKTNVDQALEAIGEANGVETFDGTTVASTNVPYGAFKRWIAEAEFAIYLQGRGHIDTGRRSVTEWRFPHGGLSEWRTALDADFVLAVMYRDSHNTTGANVANLFSSVKKHPLQIGVACLVDLRSERIAWCENSVSTIGDLRAPGAAWSSVGSLVGPILPQRPRSSAHGATASRP